MSYQLQLVQREIYIQTHTLTHTCHACTRTCARARTHTHTQVEIQRLNALFPPPNTALFPPPKYTRIEPRRKEKRKGLKRTSGGKIRGGGKLGGGGNQGGGNQSTPIWEPRNNGRGRHGNRASCSPKASMTDFSSLLYAPCSPKASMSKNIYVQKHLCPKASMSKSIYVQKHL